MQSGTVKWFDSKKGFGFITPRDGSDDVFVHYSTIESTGYKQLVDGQSVQFEAARGKKGMAATRVVPV